MSYGYDNNRLILKATQEEKGYFSSLYEMADNTMSGKLEGKVAANFLKKSGLSKGILKKIWLIAAQTNPSSIEKDEFYVALRLVALAQNNMEYSAESIRLNHPIPPLPKFDLKVDDTSSTFSSSLPFQSKANQIIDNTNNLGINNEINQMNNNNMNNNFNQMNNNNMNNNLDTNLGMNMNNNNINMNNNNMNNNMNMNNNNMNMNNNNMNMNINNMNMNDNNMNMNNNNMNMNVNNINYEISPNESENYKSIYLVNKDEVDSISIQKAKSFWSGTGISNELIDKILNLIPKQSNNSLKEREFHVCTHLIIKKLPIQNYLPPILQEYINLKPELNLNPLQNTNNNPQGNIENVLYKEFNMKPLVHIKGKSNMNNYKGVEQVGTISGIKNLLEQLKLMNEDANEENKFLTKELDENMELLHSFYDDIQKINKMIINVDNNIAGTKNLIMEYRRKKNIENDNIAKMKVEMKMSKEEEYKLLNN